MKCPPIQFRTNANSRPVSMGLLFLFTNGIGKSFLQQAHRIHLPPGRPGWPPNGLDPPSNLGWTPPQPDHLPPHCGRTSSLWPNKNPSPPHHGKTTYLPTLARPHPHAPSGPLPRDTYTRPGLAVRDRAAFTLTKRTSSPCRQGRGLETGCGRCPCSTSSRSRCRRRAPPRT